MNDVIINRKKLGKYLGEHVKTVKDRGYTIEEIKKIVDACSLKYKIAVTMMCSSGCRIGAIPSLTLSNLLYHDDKYQLSDGKYLKTPLESDSLITFFADKEAQQAIKEYEYLLNEKQSTLDNYVQYLDTACELAKVDKVQVIDIVKQKNNNNTLNRLLD